MSIPAPSVSDCLQVPAGSQIKSILLRHLSCRGSGAATAGRAGASSAASQNRRHPQCRRQVPEAAEHAVGAALALDSRVSS